MEKSIILQLENLKKDLVHTINDSHIAPYFIEPILKDLYLEIKEAAINQVQTETQLYEKSLDNNKNEDLEK